MKLDTACVFMKVLCSIKFWPRNMIFACYPKDKKRKSQVWRDFFQFKTTEMKKNVI